MIQVIFLIVEHIKDNRKLPVSLVFGNFFFGSTRVKTHKLLQVCKQVVTSLLTSCQQVVFALLVPSLL